MASGNFTTLFLMREKGMTLGQVAVYYALVVGIGMSGGIFVSGRVIDRFTRRSKQAYALVPAVSLTLAMPFYIAFVWAPTWQLGLVFLIGPTFPELFLSLVVGDAGAGRGAAGPARDVRRPAAAGHEFHRPGPRAHVCRLRPAIFSTRAIRITPCSSPSTRSCRSICSRSGCSYGWRACCDGKAHKRRDASMMIAFRRLISSRRPWPRCALAVFRRERAHR